MLGYKTDHNSCHQQKHWFISNHKSIADRSHRGKVMAQQIRSREICNDVRSNSLPCILPFRYAINYDTE